VKTIQLRRGERMVFDDGSTVSNQTPLTADITLSGSGGLDTGSEAASTWYEIYAIHKSTDDTRGLMLHRAKDWFLDETYDSDDTTVEIRKSTGTRTAVGQGFKVDTTGYVDFIDVELIRVGAVAGVIQAELQTDSSGLPSGTVLATSDKLNAGHVSTSSQWIRFIFRTPVSLTATTQYHLVLTGSWTASDAVYIGWRCDTSSATYANGTRTQKEAGTWNNTGTTAHDFSFKMYVRRNDSAVTMPSGYDGKCLLGYVYNNASSDFEPFTAVNRTVIPLDGLNTLLVVAGTASIPTLLSLATVIPPVPVRQRVRGNALGTGFFFALPVPHGFRTAAIHRDGGGSITAVSETMEILTEAQAMYTYDTSSTYDVVHDSFEW